MARTDNYEERRSAAIMAAASVFAEKGFHGASTRDIAARIGIKQGSLYYYFRSKEEALGEVCLLGIRGYLRRMESIVDSGESATQKLRAAIISHLSSYREKNEALKVHNDERLYLPVEKRRKLKQLGSRYRRLLEDLIGQGQANGEFRPGVDCHFIAYTVIGMCNAWGERIVRDDNVEVFDVARQCADLILDGLIAVD